jgi:hypothetical protein
MFSTFADVFGSDDSNIKKMNGTNNPFDSSTTVDPFGISSDMKLSASSQRFDDSPFVIDTTTITDESNRLSRSGKEALSSSNWNAYQNSPNEPNLDSSATFDPLEEIQSKSTNLSINNNIPHSKSINLMNPFSIPAMSNETSTVPNQASPIDLLFDLNVDPSTLPTTKSDNNSLINSDQIQSSYDLLGLNKKANSSPTVKVLKSDSLTDIPKSIQTKKSSPLSSLTAKSNIPTATSYHSMPINALPTSTSTLRVQATALSILTGTTSTTPFDDQYLDWLTQSDDLMCGVDPKLSGLSKKIDINMLKSTEDLLGSIYRQSPQTLTTVQEISQEIVSSPPQQLIRRPSNEELPAICIHEPTSDHDDSNIVPQGYFDNKTSKKQNDNDSDDSDDSKMVFKIGEKKSKASIDETSIPVPLLPPPPSPLPSKKYKEASEDASSSSSSPTDNEDENDPLAVFRSKSIKNKTNQKPGNNLITDWDEQEDTKINHEEERVCLMFLYVDIMLSCLYYNCTQGWCYLIFVEHFFLYILFLARESSTTATSSASGLLFT